MYTLKSIARRGTSFGAALALVVSSVGSAVLPAMSAHADALNPLTERSLTLSSSSPGWSFTDGSQNSTYAPPNSGANGQKAGNYYDFKVSTDSTVSGTNEPVKAFTFQYCTTAAGACLAPGNDGWTGSAPSATRNADDIAGQKTDLNVTVSSPTEVDASDFGTVVGTAADTGALKAVPGYSSGQAGRESQITGAAASVAGNFLVYYRTSDGGTPNDTTDDTWTPSSGWTMSVANQETDTAANAAGTGKNNQIKLTNSTGQGFAAGTQVKILFFANATNYITNPGAKEFYVRINTYKDDSSLTDANIIDGGVTVANIMNQSIWIQTKVLETMDFSVGTVNPDTLDATQLAASEKASGTHGICDRILTRMTSADPANVLKMGDPVGEYSLRTDTTYSTHSYWRLSSNSSAGATVYYSGSTLTNTSGDTINAIGATASAPSVGSEQFGLALATSGASNYLTNYTMERDSGKVYENGADVSATGLQGGSPGVDASWTSIVNASKHDNRLTPLAPTAEYGDGAGIVNADYGTIDTHFAFDDHSNEVPVAIASENSQVVDCVTGKMRYIANIAATTPAGIYTTKVNYIAAPQY